MIDTIDLEKRLRESNDFDESLISENKAPDIHILINKHIAEKKGEHSDIIRKLNVDRSYGYQLLNGRRVPTRTQLIRIGLILGLGFEELQALLKVGGKEMLYARNMSDAKVIYAVEHGLEYDKACEFIWGE